MLHMQAAWRRVPLKPQAPDPVPPSPPITTHMLVLGPQGRHTLFRELLPVPQCPLCRVRCLNVAALVAHVRCTHKFVLAEARGIRESEDGVSASVAASPRLIVSLDYSDEASDTREGEKLWVRCALMLTSCHIGSLALRGNAAAETHGACQSNTVHCLWAHSVAARMAHIHCTHKD